LPNGAASAESLCLGGALYLSSFGVTYLIIGGAGFIGSHLAEALQGRGLVRVLDNLRTGSRGNLAGLDIEFHEGSILDRDLLARVMAGADYAFHLAAMVSVPESMAHPRECEEINCGGLLNVLEAAAAARVKKLFFASSAAVYGDAPVVPKTETTLPEPRSPYAFTKLLGEHACRFFHQEGRVATVSLRFFNVFGPRQNADGPYAGVVATFIARALRGEPLVINGDGEQTRDFIQVTDIIDAILHVTFRPEISGVLNAGYGSAMTVNRLAQLIASQTHPRPAIAYGPSRAGDVRHSWAAIDLLRSTGFQPAGTLESGLSAFILDRCHTTEARRRLPS
jgi:UDP-glucose 4-epimerase